MLNKPAGYDSAEAVEGGFREPKPGPCVLGVVKCEIETKDDGHQQLAFQLDIAEGPLKNYYSIQSKRFGKNRLLRVWQKTDDDSLPYFKGLIDAFEKSNPGFKFEFDEKSLEKKLIGGNLRAEEYDKGGEVIISPFLKVGYLCSVESVKNGEHRVLPIKKLKPKGAGSGLSAADFDSAIPPSADGDPGPENF
jgi:hypothetical protein